MSSLDLRHDQSYRPFFTPASSELNYILLLTRDGLKRRHKITFYSDNNGRNKVHRDRQEWTEFVGLFMSSSGCLINFHVLLFSSARQWRRWLVKTEDAFEC